MKANSKIPTGIRWKIAATAGVIAVSAFGMSMVSADRETQLPDQIRLKDAVPVTSNSGERLVEPRTQFKVVPFSQRERFAVRQHGRVSPDTGR